MSKKTKNITLFCLLLSLGLMAFIVFGAGIKREVTIQENKPDTCAGFELLNIADATLCSGSIQYKFGLPFAYATTDADSKHEEAPALSSNTFNWAYILDALIWSLALPALYFGLLRLLRNHRRQSK